MSFRTTAFSCASGIYFPSRPLHHSTHRFINPFRSRPFPSTLKHTSIPKRSPPNYTPITSRIPSQFPSNSVTADNNNVINANILSIAKSLGDGTLKAEDLLAHYLSRIHKHDKFLNSFITIDAEQAVQKAIDIDKRRKGGERLNPLSGIPIAVKDNLCTRNILSTGASKILERYVPVYSATVVSRLEDAGMIVIGKTNLDEFGMGSSTETSGYGVTKNPWDLMRVPGGSSGGSAAAVAAGLVPVALGSDTGGSIRLPASFCGVSGLKPSYGRVSRFGLMAYASSLDTVGPIARSVEELAVLLEAIAGSDERDGTCVGEDVPDYVGMLKRAGDLKGITIGLIEETVGDNVDAEVSDAVKAASLQLEQLGASVRRVSMKGLEAATASYYIIAPSEASANLARYDGVRYGMRSGVAQNTSVMYTQSRTEGLGDEVRRRIMLGTFALSSGYYDEYYTRAQRVRAMISNRFKELFASDVDVLLSPVAPSPAFQFGEMSTDPTQMYLVDIMTIPASAAGLPALSIPCGYNKEGLPIGMQIIGPYLKEGLIMQIGHSYQQSTEFHTAKPQAFEKVASLVA